MNDHLPVESVNSSICINNRTPKDGPFVYSMENWETLKKDPSNKKHSVFDPHPIPDE